MQSRNPRRRRNVSLSRRTGGLGGGGEAGGTSDRSRTDTVEHRMNRPIPRRRALQLGLGACLALGRWPGAEAARPRRPAASFRFLVVNDTHSIGPECGPWLEGLVRQMQRHAPVAFCLHLGDITDKGLAPHLMETRRIFDQLGFPLYALLGNHDYATPTDRSGYEQAYPGRINYWFTHAGWQFVGVTNQHGFDKLETDLFKGKKVIVVPDPGFEQKAWSFAKRTGARFLMTPDKIDDLINANGYDGDWLAAMSKQARRP